MRHRRSSLGGWRGLRVRSKGGRVGVIALAVSLCLLVSAVTAGGTQPYETYESTVAADGPVAQFRFDDAVGSSTIADSVGSYTASNDGIVLGGEGPFGGSRSGSLGGEAYAALPSDPLAGASTFTVEGWVDWAGGSASKQPVFALGSSSSNYMYLTPASALTSHMMLFEIHTSGGSDVQVVAPKMAANVWRYLTVTETSEGTLTLYVDGEQLRQSTGVSLFPSSLGSAPDAYLGRSVGGEVLFGGLLSNVAFYTKALSASQVMAHYDAGEFPVATALPTISGTAKDGSALSATKGTWTGLSPITFAYQWTLCNSAGESCASIPGASESKYTLGHEDVGGTLRAAVTGSNGAGSGTATSAQSALVAPLAPSNTALPVVSGAAEQGQLLSASEGTWKGTPPLSYAYAWEQCNSTGGACKKITGATAASYRVPGSLIGDTLRVVVTAENAAGSKSATSEATAVITTGPPVNTALPAVSGTAEDGHTLSASTGSWAGTEPFSYAYQWELCNSVGESCANISGATASTYGLGPGDVGDTLRVVVTAKNSVGSTGATSPASGVVAAIPPSNTAAPTITGSDIDGQTLTATTGSWNGSAPLSYAYQWELCNSAGESCGNISGATNSTYLLGHGDVGDTLRVKVTASNTGGSASSTSAATGVVAALAPSNVSLPMISGTARDGQTLSASTGGWEGTPTISYTYQWQTCNSAGEDCANVSGATSSTYVLEHGDVGDTLRVVVRASNAGGSASGTSEASGVVTALAPSNTAVPSISGTAEEGQTLSASTGSWEGTPPLSYGYQWERCNAFGEACLDIAGATSSAYIPGAGDVGSTLRVSVTAMNSAGSASSASAATAVVLGSVVEGEPPGELEAPSISGTPDADDVLYAESGVWAGTPTAIVYQWESCSASGGECAAIEGATGAEYELGEGDVGITLRVRVGASYARDAISAVSPVTPAIGAAGALANTSAPVVSGTPQRGQALSAGTGRWSSTEALAYTYQWQRCDSFGAHCMGIEGATGSSYTAATGDVGSALRVVVSASDSGHSLSASSSATQPIAATSAPVVDQPPQIAGSALEGDTLIATAGTWSGESPTGYAYRWERCNQAGECSAIEGASESSYTLSASDVGSTVRALVSATNAGGSSTAVSNPTADVEPKALLKLSAPSISGVVQMGGTLSAEAGIWSGSGPVSYGYQWESCNSGGGECAPIGGATESTYLLGGGALGSTLRVKLTLTGPFGGASAVSAPTVVVPGGELSVEAAREVTQRTDSALLAASTSTTLEEQTIAPVLHDTGEELAAQSTLTGSSVSKETPGEVSVNTPSGELALTPLETLGTATTDPTIVNGAAALFANTWPATDAIVRADPLGAAAILQIRSAEAPSRFSWEARLGPDQQLQQLAGGSVAVINSLEGKLPGEGQQPDPTPLTEAGQPQTPTEETEAEHEEAEAKEAEAKGETEAEVPLESLPEAPTATTPPAESGSGLPQPQQTQAEYEAAQSAMSSAEAQTAGQALMTIKATVTDAAGDSVPASLSVLGDKITLTTKAGSGAVYPLIADLSIAAPSDKVSAERDPVRYGLSDQTPGTFAKEENEKLVEEKGKPIDVFDPNLQNAEAPLHVTTARLVIPYDVFFTPTSRAATRLTNWLKGVEAAGLQPYITLGPDDEATCTLKKDECFVPSLSNYRSGVRDLIRNEPGVKLWGAWNEPDLKRYPMAGHAHLAAKYWQVAEYVAARNCTGCKMVAGEFAFENEYHGRYISEYRETIAEQHKFPPCKFCSHARPSIWGFHDYHDVVHDSDAFADKFTGFAGRRHGKAQIWISEAGAELQTGGEKPTTLAEGSRKEQEEKQATAAEDFEHLHSVSTHIERIYYYEYRAPTEQQQEKGELALPKIELPFDSGLLEAEPEGKGKSKGEVRPAYCVLAFADHSCKPTVTTLKPTEPGEELRASIDANGLTTSVAVERMEPGETTWSKIREATNIGHGLGAITMSLQCEINNSRSVGGITAPVRYAATNADGTTYSATETYHWCRT